MSRTETVELANICLIYKDDKILLQNRTKDDWKGYTLPGGHVEKDESFIDSVIREMKEETGLTIRNPILCGVKQFSIKNGRYIIFLYKTNEFEGVLTSSDEGEVEWVYRKDLWKYDLVPDFHEVLKIIDDDSLSEFQYIKDREVWRIQLI